MAIVSSDPGGTSGALGVITLEDVIEELIGEVTIHYINNQMLCI
jgi:CBS domain containing-hemolysin-like protein